MRMLVLPSALRALAPVESERGKRARSASPRHPRRAVDRGKRVIPLHEGAKTRRAIIPLRAVFSRLIGSRGAEESVG